MHWSVLSDSGLLQKSLSACRMCSEREKQTAHSVHAVDTTEMNSLGLIHRWHRDLETLFIHKHTENKSGFAHFPGNWREEPVAGENLKQIGTKEECFAAQGAAHPGVAQFCKSLRLLAPVGGSP